MPEEVDPFASLPLPSFPVRLKDRLPDAVRCPQDVIDWLYKLANRIGKLPSDASSPYLSGYVESLEDAQALLEHTRSRGWFGPFPAHLLGDNSGASFDTKLYLGASKMARDMGRFDERPDPDHDEDRVQWALRAIAEWFDREKVKLCGGGIVRPADQTPAEPDAPLIALTTKNIEAEKQRKKLEHPVLDEIDVAILNALIGYPHADKLVDLAMTIEKDRDTCGEHVKRLIELHYVARKSPRSGVSITDRGREHLNRLNSALIPH